MAGGVRISPVLPSVARPSVDQMRSQAAQTGGAANTQGQADLVQKDIKDAKALKAAQKPPENVGRIAAITPHSKHAGRDEDEQKRRRDRRNLALIPFDEEEISVVSF